jgi:hypothetical protein
MQAFLLIVSRSKRYPLGIGKFMKEFIKDEEGDRGEIPAETSGASLLQARLSSAKKQVFRFPFRADRIAKQAGQDHHVRSNNRQNNTERLKSITRRALIFTSTQNVRVYIYGPNDRMPEINIQMHARSFSATALQIYYFVLQSWNIA